MAEPVDLVIERGVVLPMTGEDQLVWDGAVAVDGNRIVAVGTSRARPSTRASSWSCPAS
jgi:predicted amidohydrolase YtcJ